MNAVLIQFPVAEAAVRPADQAVKNTPPRQGKETCPISFTEVLAGETEQANENTCGTEPETKDVSRQEEEEEERTDEAAGIGGCTVQIYWAAPPQAEASRPALQDQSARAESDWRPAAEMEDSALPAAMTAETAAQSAQKTAFPAGISDEAEAFPLREPGVAGGIPAVFTEGNQETRPVQADDSAAGQPEGTVHEAGQDILQRIVQAMQPPQSGGDASAERRTSGERTIKEEGPSNRAGEQGAVPAGFYPPDTVPHAGAEGASPKSEAVERALGSFLEDFKSAESAGSEIRLVLEPEDMGEMTISVLRSEEGISATIRSADKEVCAAVGSQLQRLIESMESRGIAVRDVDVLLEQGGAGEGFGGRRNGEGDGQPAFLSYSSGKRKEQGGAGFFRLWQMSPDVGGGETGGTVEYRV